MAALLKMSLLTAKLRKNLLKSEIQIESSGKIP